MKKSRQSIISYILFATVVLSPMRLFADEELVKELQSKIQDSAGLIQNLDAEILQYQQQLNQVSGERKTLEGAVKELSITEKRIQATLQSTSLKIKDTQNNIQNLNLSIEELGEKIDRNTQLITTYIQTINELETSPMAFAILREKDFGQMVRVLNTYNQIHTTFQNEIREFTQDLENLGVVKRTKEEEQIHFQKLAEEHAVEKQIVQKTKTQKNEILKETKSEEAEYQKIVNEKIALKKQFEESLTKFESELKYILDPTSYPKEQHGIFAWPLDYILITQPFGLTPDSAKLYGYRTGQWSGRHTGVDFRANNDKVYAMASGTVVDFGNTDKDCPKASYGGWMLIGYDNGLSSIYSHLSSFSAVKGQRVSAGTLVGISGNTGYSTGPHLDVKVIPSGAVTVETWPSKGCPGKNYTTPIVAGSTYFNPLGYLPKASADMFK